MSHRSKPSKRMPSMRSLMARPKPKKKFPSYEQGTDYVPKTGPAMLHEGEAVISAEQNKLQTYDKKTEADLAEGARQANEQIRKRRAGPTGLGAASAAGRKAREQMAGLDD